MSLLHPIMVNNKPMELQVIQNKIYEIRGMRVLLDFDLAGMYLWDHKLGMQ